MTRKYPPSILIALYTSLVLTLIFVVFKLLGIGEENNFLLESISFFVISLILFTIILEFFVYSRIKDLTESKEKEISKLKEVETFRREFLGDVSHELKTPIFAIEGFVETLLDGALEDKKVNRKFLQKVLKHAERLNNLVQDILVITQIETGDLAMKPEPFDINQMAHEIVDSLETKFTKKGRNITALITAEGLENYIVMADKQRIDQVMYNLIDNAVKYGDPQGTIKVQLVFKSPNIEISVHDDGPGIQKEHQERIFQRFYRVEKSRSRERGGTGLGLSICKHLIEAHDHKIWVESSPGEGTTFRFTLPAAS